MTITALTPVAIAAGLLLPLTMASLAWTAEPVAKPIKPLAAGSVAVATQNLDFEITVDFTNTTLAEVVQNLRRLMPGNLVLDHRLEEAGQRPITLKVTKMKCRVVLDFVERLAGASHQEIGGTYYICAQERLTEPHAHLDLAEADHDPSLMKKLDEHVTLHLTGTQLHEALDSLHKISGINCILGQADLANRNFSVIMKDARIRDVLQVIAMQAEVAIIATGGTLQVLPLTTPRGRPSVPPRQPTDLSETEQYPELNKALNQRVTFDFQESEVSDVMKYLELVTGTNMVVAANVRENSRPITLKVKDMRFVDALKWISELAGLTVQVVHGAIYFQAASPTGAPNKPQQTDLSGAEKYPDLNKVLAQPLTFDYQDTELVDVIAYLQLVTGANIVVDANVIKKGRTITMKVEEMQVADALKFIAKLTDLNVMVLDGAIYFQAASSTGAPNKILGVQPAPSPEEKF